MTQIRGADQYWLPGGTQLGIDSVQCPRLAVWELIAGQWKPDALEMTAAECTLQTFEGKIQAILNGNLRGRTLVNLLNS